MTRIKDFPIRREDGDIFVGGDSARDIYAIIAENFVILAKY